MTKMKGFQNVRCEQLCPKTESGTDEISGTNLYSTIWCCSPYTANEISTVYLTFSFMKYGAKTIGSQLQHVNMQITSSLTLAQLNDIDCICRLTWIL